MVGLSKKKPRSRQGHGAPHGHEGDGGSEDVEEEEPPSPQSPGYQRKRTSAELWKTAKRKVLGMVHVKQAMGPAPEFSRSRKSRVAFNVAFTALQVYEAGRRGDYE